MMRGKNDPRGHRATRKHTHVLPGSWDIRRPWQSGMSPGMMLFTE